MTSRPEANHAGDDLDWMLAWVAAVPAATWGFLAAQRREERLPRLGRDTASTLGYTASRPCSRPTSNRAVSWRAGETASAPAGAHAASDSGFAPPSAGLGDVRPAETRHDQARFWQL
jgi:hypothetical protein